MTELEAKDILRGMTTEDCIEMFNEKVIDGKFELSTIHGMYDDEWWEKLFKERRAHDILEDLLHSDFDIDIHTHFFYNEDMWEFFSFSEKEELIEYVGEDFFLDEIINRN